MKLSLTILSATVGAASAFAPSGSISRATSIAMSTEPVEPVVNNAVEAAVPEGVVPTVAPINGWVPDAVLPCYGLPGAIEPLGYFDPLGFCKDRELGGVKRFREAEIMHGRVAVSRYSPAYIIFPIPFLSKPSLPGF